MEPVSVSVTIEAPRERIFEYLADIANHPEFTDHFLTEWHLTRVESYGAGAGARFRLKAPFQRFDWADLSFAAVQPPHRLLAVGRGGKFNRDKLWWEWRLDPVHDGTKVSLTADMDVPFVSDRFIRSFGYRGSLKRNLRKSLKRLAGIIEEGKGRGERATIGGLSGPAWSGDH